MDGSAKVYKKESDKPDAKEMELMSLGKFDYFGERALFNDAPRAATVRAVEEMKLLQIGRETFEQVLGSLEDIIKYNCRKREEAAHQTYLQRQAEGMLHASPQEFEPVARLAANEVSDLYVVKRKPKIDEDAPASATGTERLLVRVVSKKKTTEENLRSRVMSEIKLVGDMLPSAFIPSLLATFSDKHRMYAVMGCILSMELTRAVGHSALLDVADGEKTAKFFVTALMCAIIHLHKQEIACRDVSMESIMLDSKGYPQVTRALTWR
jgi:serine/threonine protein kinase